MSILDDIRNRLSQEQQAILTGHLGLGSDPRQPGITMPLGRFSAPVLAPLHMLGLAGEGTENAAQAIMGTLGGLIVGSQQKGYYALHPNETPTPQDQHYINAFDQVMSGHPIAANQELGRANEFINALGTFATNPMNLVGLGDVAAGSRVAAASPRLQQALRGASVAGRLLNDLPITPVKAVIGAARAEEGARLAAAGKPLVEAMVGKLPATEAAVPRTIPQVTAPPAWSPEQQAVLAADPEVQRLQEMIDVFKRQPEGPTTETSAGGNFVSQQSKSLKGLGFRLSAARKQALRAAGLDVNPLGTAQPAGETPALANQAIQAIEQPPQEEPLVLYHGSPRQFAPEDITTGRPGMYGSAISLTTDRNRALGYARELGTEGVVHSYYPQITNPIEIGQLPPQFQGVGGKRFDELFSQLRDPQGQPYDAVVDEKAGNVFVYDRGKLRPVPPIPPATTGTPEDQLTQIAKNLFDPAIERPPGGNVIGMQPSLARDYSVLPRHEMVAQGRTLEDVVDDPQRVADIRRLFAGMTEPQRVSTLLQGQQNAAARKFAELVAPNWLRAQGGRLTKDDIINAYIPAILSQQRGAVQPDSTWLNKLRSSKTPEEFNALLQRFDQAKVQPLDQSFGLDRQGFSVGGYRPEDMAARLLHDTPEGQRLFQALRGNDPQEVAAAATAFGKIFPQSSFFTGKTGEIVALQKAVVGDRFQQTADMINRLASSGHTPEQIAEPLRAGGVLPRINVAKGGFVVNNLGGPAGTFDSRAQKTMFPGATIYDYIEGLKQLYPDLTSGEAHHALWDAQDFGQTPHTDIAESVRRIARGQVPGGTTGGTPDLAAGLSPSLVQRLRPQEQLAVGDVPLAPPQGAAQQARNTYQQAYLNDPVRVARDEQMAHDLALKAYVAKTKTTQGFEDLWQRTKDWVEQTKTLSMGIGDAKSADAIIKSGQPLSNGMYRYGVTASEQDFPEALVKAKAAALGINKVDSARYNEAIAYGAAQGITDPAEAVKAYAKYFLRLEAGSFGRIGLGDPTLDPNAVHPMYASLTEGQPALNQMGGGIHLILDHTQVPFTATAHHPFSFESPVVLPMHEMTASPFKQNWGPEKQAALAAQAGRPAMQTFGPEGQYQISGSPQLTGPAGSTALRAASLIMAEGSGADLLKLAVTDPERAAALLVRSTPGKARGFGLEAAAKQAALGKDVTPGIGYNLAINPSAKRSEAMVQDLQPQYVKGIVVKGNNEKTLVENAQAAQRFMAHFGLDVPIYIAYGPEGTEPGLYQLTPDGPVLTTLSQGRQNLIDKVKSLGEQNYGIAPQQGGGLALQAQGQTPAQWLNTPVMTGVPGGNRLAMIGSGGLIGGALGGTQGDTPEDRLRNAATGAAVGAGVGGALVSARGYNLIRNAPQIGKFAKGLLGEAVAAQKASVNRTDKGIASLKTLTSVWKVQATSTLRNLLQDEATARLWLANAGVRQQLINDNWQSMVQLYNAGVRDPYDALPTMTTTVLDALGKQGYIPKVGASFADANQGIIKTLSAADTAKAEGLLSLANPLQGGIPVLGTVLAGAKGYTRAFQQSLFNTLNEFTKVASRHAAFQDVLERELPGAADQFINQAKQQGIDLSTLAGRSGLFSPTEVDQLAPGLGATWGARTDAIIAQGEQKAKDILGDYAKKLPGEKAVSAFVPFVSWALRAYPRTAKMMINHPGVSLMLMLLMAKGAQQAQQTGLPGYLASGVPISTDTPVLGGVARALNGGQPGTAYAQPMQLLSPVGGSLFAGDNLAPDANTYQKATSILDRIGFSPNPLVQAYAAATNADYRMPGALSRTAPIEQSLPGPQIPSLAAGAINFVRQQAGGTPITTTTHDRLLAAEFYRRTGVPINDPRVQASPALAGLLAQTLDPNSEISQTVDRQEREQGAARVVVGMSSPIGVSGQSDVQQIQNQAKAQEQALPPAVVDPYLVQQMMGSPYLAERIQARKYAAQNQGTQGQQIPEAHITSRVSGDYRAKEILAAWQAQNLPLMQIAPVLYRREEAALKKQLGLP